MVNFLYTMVQFGSFSEIEEAVGLLYVCDFIVNLVF